MSIDRQNRLARILPLMPVLAIAIVVAGCGGYKAGTSMTPSPVATPQVKAQVKIGDAPAARVVAVEVAVGPITMTDDARNTLCAYQDTAHRTQSPFRDQ